MTQELFDRIINWQKKTFKEATPLSKLAHLKEEIAEVEFDLLHKGYDPTEEYADCFLLLLGSAAAYGMNLEQINEAISKKMDKNEKRVWGTPDANGVVRHIKE